jgi:putative ABC transport system permease protein
VSANLFSVLGVRPSIGRDFTDADTGTQVVILSDALWRSHFGADRDVAGKTLTFDAQSYVVIGVMPRGFIFPRVLSADVWMPGDMTVARGDPSGRHVQTMARLAPGATLDAATAELQTRSRQIALASGATTSPWTMFLVPAGETTSASSRLAFQALLATVGLFLLVACANLAGLMLARNTARRAEFAVCLSIGASRWRLTRLLLIEALLLAGAGAVAGVLLAMSGARALAAVMPPRMPGLEAVGVNPAVAIVAVAAAFVSALLIALLPAVRLRHLRPADALAGGRTIARGTVRAQRWLVAGEVALAVTLLVGGAAMLQSFSAAIHRDRGYLPEHLHALNVSLPFSDDSYLPVDRRARAFEDILARVASVPGVRQVGATTGFPGSQLGILGASEIAIAGRSPLIAAIHSASDTYFAAMGMPIQTGRAFTRADSFHAAPVAIVNALLAREFPDGNPIGRHIPVGVFGETRQYEIVGVAGNIRLGEHVGYRVFVPLAQASPYWIDLVFRTDGRLGAAADVRRALRDHSRDLLLENESSFQTIISDSLGLQRAQTTVVALVGGLSAVVAAIGIYALLTFLGAQRRRDMGIRIALGSPPGRLFRETFLGALRLVGAGVVIGIATAMLLVRVLGAQVFGLTSADAGTHVAAAAVVLGVAVVAVWIPARRVMRIDPLIALRME